MTFRGLSNVNKVSGGIQVRDKRTGEVFTIDRNKARISRLRRRVFAWVNLVKPIMGRKYRMVMQTLTYEEVGAWQPNHIRAYMLTLRDKLGEKLVAYAWVAELQRRGAVHYHLLLVVDKGTSVPKPDKAGWWDHGLTRVETARTPYYIATYTGKEYQKEGDFPKGLRMFAVWLSDSIMDDVRKWAFRLSTLPGWFRKILQELPEDQKGARWVRPPGGGWLYMDVRYESPYEVLGI